MSTWPGWERDILTAIKAPINADTTKFLDEWHSYEGGVAINNPLNTTQPEAGATNYNGAGVKNYPSSQVGTTATRATLENGRYPDILAALRSGKPFAYGDKGAVEREIQTWGTFGFAAWYAQQGVTIPAPPKSAPKPGDPVAPAALNAWTHFTQQLGVNLPTQLRRAKAVRRAALRSLR